MYTVTLIHKDGQSNVTHEYDSYDEADFNFDGRILITPSIFPGTYRPFVAVAMHAAGNPIPVAFHVFA